MLTRNTFFFFFFLIHDLISITIKPANIKKHKLQIQQKINNNNNNNTNS